MACIAFFACFTFALTSGLALRPHPLEYLASKSGMKSTYEFILFIIFTAAVMFPVT